jgi:hypothetical protein
LTYGEAKAAYRGHHVWWHGSQHCWSEMAPPRRPIRDKPPVIDKHEITTKLDEPVAGHHAEIFYPAIIVIQIPTPWPLLRGELCENWPALFDIDARFDPWRERVTGAWK